MTSRTAALCVSIMALWAIAFTATAHADTSAARPVSLSQASIEPTWMVYVPGISISHGRVRAHRVTHAATPCPHGTYFSDVSAYRWDGSALGAQHWSHARQRMLWNDTPEGGRVAYDGVTFVNRTTRAVLVAGWCE